MNTVLVSDRKKNSTKEKINVRLKPTNSQK